LHNKNCAATLRERSAPIQVPTVYGSVTGVWVNRRRPFLLVPRTHTLTLSLVTLVRERASKPHRERQKLEDDRLESPSYAANICLGHVWCRSVYRNSSNSPESLYPT